MKTQYQILCGFVCPLRAPTTRCLLFLKALVHFYSMVFLPWYAVVVWHFMVWYSCLIVPQGQTTERKKSLAEPEYDKKHAGIIRGFPQSKTT